MRPVHLVAVAVLAHLCAACSTSTTGYQAAAVAPGGRAPVICVQCTIPSADHAEVRRASLTLENTLRMVLM